MPKALLQLELALGEGVSDLREISDIIKSDVGLTAQFLRLAFQESHRASDRVPSISELVIQIGTGKLRTLLKDTPSVSTFLSSSVSSACERFWMHARLSALIAEELASQTTGVQREDAYLAGLFCHFSSLPMLLGWEMADQETRDLGYLTAELACSWGFPRQLVEVIHGSRHSCGTESRALLDIAAAASTWAYRLEFLAARESGTCSALVSPSRLERG